MRTIHGSGSGGAALASPGAASQRESCRVTASARDMPAGACIIVLASSSDVSTSSSCPRSRFERCFFVLDILCARHARPSRDVSQVGPPLWTLVCPITNAIFEEPVVASDWRTYSKQALSCLIASCKERGLRHVSIWERALGEARARREDGSSSAQIQGGARREDAAACRRAGFVADGNAERRSELAAREVKRRAGPIVCAARRQPARATRCHARWMAASPSSSTSRPLTCRSSISSTCPAS